MRPEPLDEWVTRWRTLVVPLRQQFGFEISRSWVDRERGAHIWVISYDGGDSFEAANASYWASQQRKAMGLDLSQFLLGEQVRQVEAAL